MFARLRKYLKSVVGNALYWIGCALAVFVIALAIILAISSGNPLIPLLLGGVGVIVWLIAIRLRRILVGSSLPGPGGLDRGPQF